MVQKRVVPLQAVILADSYDERFRPVSLERPRVRPKQRRASKRFFFFSFFFC